MGWQERGAFEVVPLQSPQRSAAGGVGLISPLLALSAQVEELDPAGGESRKGKRRERRTEGGRVQMRERGRKSNPDHSPSSSLTFSSLFPCLSLLPDLILRLVSH